MIRTAVIGLSKAGYEHARAYKTDALAELVGVCDHDSVRAEEVAAQMGVPAFSTYADLIAAAKPDLCTVYSGLPAEIRALLDAGVHVLSSLPFARDMRQALELMETARRKNVILCADFHPRFTPAVAQARRWLAEGKIGTPLFVNLNLWTAWDDGVSAQGEESADPYALFRTLGAHGVDMMRHFCGDVARVYCVAVKAPGRATWSSAQVNMQFADGTVGTLTASRDMVPHHPMARCEVAGTKARFVIDNVYEEATLYVHDEEEKRVVTNSIFGGIAQLRETYARRIHQLLVHLNEGGAPEECEGGARDALAAGATMEAAIEALESDSVAEVRAAW